MSIKYIKENFSEIYKRVDKEALRWIFKNKRLLREKFSKKFPKSPSLFVVQIKTKRGSLLVYDYEEHDYAEIRRVNNVAYLNLRTLKRLGCPISL